MSRTQELISNGLNLVQKINEILNDNAVPCEKLFLGNLAVDTTAQDLKYFFRKYNPIRVRAQIKSKPCIGFVDFKDTETATLALNELNGTLCNNRRVRISYCKPFPVQEEHERKRRRVGSPEDFYATELGEIHDGI